MTSLFEECSQVIDILRPVIISLKCVGFWNDPDPKSVFNTVWYKLYRMSMMAILIIFCTTGFLYMIIHFKTINLEEATSVLYFYITCAMNFTMMMLIISKKETLFQLFEKLRSEIFMLKNDEQQKFLNLGISSSKHLCYFYAFEFIFLLTGSSILTYYKTEEYIVIAYTPSWVPHRFFQYLQLVAINCNVAVCATYIVLNTTLMIQAGVEVDLLKSDLVKVETKQQLVECFHHYKDIVL